jgi:hypothetical protein
MRRHVVIIWILLVALVVSNGWWLIWLVDAGISATHREVTLETYRKAATALVALAPVAARADATPEQVVEAAKRAAHDHMTFEKDGAIWVAGLGLKFGTTGRLVEVVPGSHPF